MVVNDPRLSRNARSEIERTTRLRYSVANFWEIGLKLSGRGFDFTLPHNWHQELVEEMNAVGAMRLPIEPEHCRQLQELAGHHKDPFDRLLIAQAQVEDLTIVTPDRRFREYRVRVTW